jgi:hypothetical protein
MSHGNRRRNSPEGPFLVSVAVVVLPNGLSRAFIPRSSRFSAPAVGRLAQAPAAALPVALQCLPQSRERARSAPQCAKFGPPEVPTDFRNSKISGIVARQTRARSRNSSTYAHKLAWCCSV